MLKNKKNLTIWGLSIFAVALVGLMFALSQPPKQADVLDTPDETVVAVAPDEIKEIPVVAVPEIKVENIQKPTAPIPTTKPDEIELTKIEDKPEPPEKPDTAVKTDTEKPHEVPTDTVLTNPAVKPDVTPKPVEPTKPIETPKTNTPKNGDKNDKGQIYIDGFGWVKNEGGGGQGEKSKLDPAHTDFDKIIGY